MSEEVKQEGDFKIKKTPKKLVNKNTNNTTKAKQDAVQEPEAKEPVLQVDEPVKEKGGDVKVELQEVGETHTEPEPSSETKEEVVIEEVTKEVNNTLEDLSEFAPQVAEPNMDLPENVEKLVEFMKETGGDLTDYVRLNTDYSKLDNDELLVEYYLKTKPHLNREEVEFVLDEEFLWDDDNDSEREIKIKKLKLKEELSKARGFLEETKAKYYDDIKLRSNATPEQKKNQEFIERYNNNQEVIKRRQGVFTDKTKNFFTGEFEGFEFNVSDKRFKYKVNNTASIADQQSNLDNFIGKFLDKNGEMADYNGYHKALYTARNADSIAEHFYEQGKADAIKDITAKSKNIQTESRTSPGDVSFGGYKVKAISGAESSKLRIKQHKK